MLPPYLQDLVEPDGNSFLSGSSRQLLVWLLSSLHLQDDTAQAYAAKALSEVTSITEPIGGGCELQVYQAKLPGTVYLTRQAYWQKIPGISLALPVGLFSVTLSVSFSARTTGVYQGYYITGSGLSALYLYAYMNHTTYDFRSVTGVFNLSQPTTIELFGYSSAGLGFYTYEAGALSTTLSAIGLPE